MKYSINQTGQNVVKAYQKSAGFAIVMVPVMLCPTLMNVSNGQWSPVILVLVGVVIFFSLSTALVKRGRRFNALVAEIELTDTEFTFSTHKTTLYPVRKLTGDIRYLQNVGGKDFSFYKNQIVLRYPGFKETDFYIIKDFFGDYEVIFAKLTEDDIAPADNEGQKPV